jgi:hypothetical protein
MLREFEGIFQNLENSQKKRMIIALTFKAL